MTVKLISYSKDYIKTILCAISQCYGKQATPKVLQGVIESGHTSVLEHSMASFEIQCSLSVLMQITRHRHLSFSVKSTRVAEFNDYYLDKFGDTYAEDIMISIDSYKSAINGGVPIESAAYLLPKATMTSMVVSGNLRAWLEYLPHRLCNRALPEHRIIAERIASELSIAMPEIFNRTIKRCTLGCKETSCGFGGKQ